MLKRIYAIFMGRNREFLRDRSSLAWNLLLPVALVFGLSYAFDGQRDEYTVGVLQAEEIVDTSTHPFLETRFVRFVAYDDIDEAMLKLERHQIDLLVDIGPPTRYWVNPTASKGYFVEFALLQASSSASSNVVKEQVTGAPVRYADWILPGILGIICYMGAIVVTTGFQLFDPGQAIEYGYTFDEKDLPEILKRCSEPELQYATDEDTTGPDLQITYPTAGTQISIDESLELKIRVSDSGTGVREGQVTGFGYDAVHSGSEIQDGVLTVLIDTGEHVPRVGAAVQSGGRAYAIARAAWAALTSRV